MCVDCYLFLQRAARSQISTAVSFEGARAAGSAALPSRSLEEESALSAAEADGKQHLQLFTVSSDIEPKLSWLC